MNDPIVANADARTRRILMCAPDYYGIDYEINPWMHREKSADKALARQQWQQLVAILESLGAATETLAPVEGLPDMVFTANAGVVWRDLFVTTRFRHEERRGESPHFERWFVDHGFRTVCIPTPGDFEGAGDALFCGDILFAGYLHRSEFRAHQKLATLLGCQVLGMELVDPRFYHLDTCFCPLAAGFALYYPGAFDEYGRRVLAEHVPRLIEVGESDAERFACNAVVLGQNVVLNAGCDRTYAALERAGLCCHPTDLSEFLKAGGSAKCLTLRLDGEDAALWS